MGCVVKATPRPFYHRERPGTHIYEAGWAQHPVWTGAEILTPPPGFGPRTVQPFASRFTDYDILAQDWSQTHIQMNPIWLRFVLTGKESDVDSSWNVMAHVDAGRASEGETGEWSG